MVMMKTLKQNEANVFSLPFDSVRNIGKVVSADKAICLYSWVVPLRERNIYNVVFQRADGYSFLLRKTVGKEPVDEYKIYDNSWYGALYYNINIIIVLTIIIFFLLFKNLDFFLNYLYYMGIR